MTDQLAAGAPEMSAICAAVPPAKPRRRDSRRSHGRAKLLTLDRLDRRTAAAQRAHALVKAIEADMGGGDCLSEGARQLVQRAAVLGTFIESCGGQMAQRSANRAPRLYGGGQLSASRSRDDRR